MVGESGSGKTTLLQLLAGRARADAGDVQLPRRGTKALDVHRAERSASGALLARTDWGFVAPEPAPTACAWT